MAYSCFTVLRKIITQPLTDNIIWYYIIKPILYFLVFVISCGLIYLYLVPFTNIVGQALFADFTCPNSTGVWQTCGKTVFLSNQFDPNADQIGVGFFVFLIIQSTIGLFLLSILLYYCSRRKGYMKRFTWSDCIPAYFCYGKPKDMDEWIITDPNANQLGPHQYFQFTILLFFSILVTTIVFGICIGRLIAVNSISQCLSYKNTRIGLFGCVSNANGQYVGGQTCNSCTGIGFGILGIPLLILEIIAVLIYYCLKKCYRSFKDTEAEIRRQRGIEQIP
ncbi:MAG: hypothetical protein Barrevirus17_3 [Barrevirus sp.]|uniref:Uncharacterized protein n=1 Tax=Barrevirus sp. TaxID=2487763 RepID=A0A3G4ZQL7_9VIRU|nr:MAG: hypothetical protein Barrevirus17_3 [Barrevirus sp.]